MGKQIRGSITCPIIISWTLFVFQFVYIGLVLAWQRFFPSYLDVIMNIILLFSLEIIAVLLTLSSRKESIKFYNFALGFSVLNVLFIFLSITVDIFAFFFKEKLNGIIRATEIKYEDYKVLIFTGITGLKVLEILPLVFIIVYLGKISGEAGSIDNPQGAILSNDNDEI